MQGLEALIRRLESLVERAENLLPPPPAPPDWSAIAYRWRGRLMPVPHPHMIRLADLKGVDEQKAAIDRNTRQFVAGRPANNVLLTGARGTGKSSLVKGVLAKYARRGLRLIEVDRDDLVDLPEIIELIAGRPERFVVFCDDLSFDASEPGYKALKSALDGSIAGAPENLLIYATSNRRHLMPERMSENLEATRGPEGEIHPGETTEEKISLSERFGLWLSFYPFDQDAYLAICVHWLRQFGVDEKSALAARQEALQWALQRGSRSGRVAWQFARDYAGRIK
ncbi:ATP-binding protein [Sulfuricystis multivorans]|uniref:ATP-binding protein n=1 Tax=Sulfuricystis multivorans TaxID=2211108 RepID=UPI000F8437F9|nr:ATP-binding protein [Sulfuricystis multivorans]